MNYKLIHLDAKGNLTKTVEHISYLAFVKHLAFAGIGAHKSTFMTFRYLGYFWEFFQYWDKNPNAFNLPTVFQNDPTEKAYVSNRIGRAFTDHLCKKLYNARFTHSYEDAMVRAGYPIIGPRPDFYCDNLIQQFAVEAKGKSVPSVSDNEMNTHKVQSQTGKLPVNFTIASVAFNLYKKPTVKFYDPINSDVKYNTDINQQLRSLYYNSILEILEIFGSSRANSEHRDYYSYYLPEFFYPNFRLLVHKVIVDREWSDNKWLESIEFKDTNDSKYFIDKDGIGLTFEKH